MSLISLLSGLNNPSMGGAQSVGSGPMGPSPLLDLLLPQQDRKSLPNHGMGFFDGPASGMDDPGLVRPGQTSPQDILRNTIGKYMTGGGGMTPNVAVAPPRVPSGVLNGDVRMDNSPQSLHMPNPFAQEDTSGSIMGAPSPISLKGEGGVDQLGGNPMQDALKEQGIDPKGAIADAWAGLTGKSVTPPTESTPQNAQAAGGAPTAKFTPSAELRRQSISRIESGSAGGNYRAIGKPSKTGDRAYGRYQMMGANIGPWTQQVLGRRLSAQEFLANPAAQDKVFDEIFGEAVQKYGDAGAASVWFTGSPTPSGKKDVGGTVDHDYVSRYMSGLGMPMDKTNNDRPGTGDASVMEAMQPGVTNAASGGGSDQMMANPAVPADQQSGGGGGSEEQQAPTPEQLEQVRSMSLKERLALLQQFMQLGGFKPGEGTIG